jgi:hypothetical protein
MDLRRRVDELSHPFGLSQGGTTIYAPVMESKDPNRDPHTPRDDDSPAVAEWRQRMGTDEAKAIYRERAATAECVNALAHNLMRAVALRAAGAQMAMSSG